VPIDGKSIGLLFYLALFGSVISMFTYNRAVDLVGPNRAAQFVNLIPVFGSVMAIGFLGETLRLYHVVGYLLVMAGVLIGTRRTPAPAPTTTATPPD
jgi:drug/metabolite transporter (DMT)-like permease